MPAYERKTSVVRPTFSFDDDEPKPKEPESVAEPTPRPSVKDPPPKEPTAKKAGKTTRARTRSTAPPNRVSPGWVHTALATKILQFLKAKVTEETGNDFNVGNLPKDEVLARDAGIIDDRQPVELLARILAHIMHRIPGGSKIERRLEGKDSSSGILSDFSAFFTQLYTMNEDTFDAVRHNVVQQAKAKKAASGNGGMTNVPS